MMRKLPTALAVAICCVFLGAMPAMAAPTPDPAIADGATTSAETTPATEPGIPLDAMDIDPSTVRNGEPPGWEPSQEELEGLLDRAIGQYRSGLVDEAYLRDLSQRLGVPLPESELAAARLSMAPAQAPPTAHMLPLIYAQQDTSYWCGPATGFMVAATNRENTSRYDGSALTQARLAHSDYMATTQAYGTDRSRWALGMNRWLGITAPSIYQFRNLASPYLSDILVALKERIGTWGTGMALNTWEGTRDPRYNRHDPRQTWGHFIMAYGYTDTAWTSHWADPGAHLMGCLDGSQVCGGVPGRTFGASTPDIVGYAAQRGMVY